MINVFSVGVSITLVDNVTKGLGTVSGALLTANKQVNTFQQNLVATQNKLNMLQGVGSIGSMMFRASGGFMNSALDAAKEYANEVNVMNMRGLDAVEIQKNIGAAAKASSLVMTTSITDNLKALGDFNTILGTTHKMLGESRNILPTFQSMTAILRASAENPSLAKNADEQAFAALKAIEMRGKLTTDSIESDLKQMARVTVATRGRVTPADYQSLMKYARQAKMGLNDEFLFGVMPELVMEMKTAHGGAGGSGGPGVLVAGGYRMFAQGIMNKVTAANLQELGLLKAELLSTATTGTTAKKFGGVVGKELYERDPDRWVQEYFRPAMEKRFAGKSYQELGMLIPSVLKGNQSAITFIQELWQKHPQFQKFKDSMQREKSFNQLFDAAMMAPSNAELAAAKQWRNTMTVIGNQVLPKVVPALISFAAGLNQVGTFLTKHPTIAKLAAFAGVMGVVGGGLLMVGAQIGTLAIVAGAAGLSLGAVGTALGVATAATAGLVAVLWKWDAISKFAVNTYNMLGGAMQRAAAAVMNFINHIPGIGTWHFGPQMAYAGASAASANSSNPAKTAVSSQGPNVHIHMDNRMDLSHAKFSNLTDDDLKAMMHQHEINIHKSVQNALNKNMTTAAKSITRAGGTGQSTALFGGGNQ